MPPHDRSLAWDPELMSDFIVESREHLVNIESQVLTLEREPSDCEALNAVFRGFHTIKGLAGFLELWEVQKLAHEVETVLDRARNSEWTINPAGIDVILESADYLRRWLVHVEAVLHHEASEAPARDEALLARITRLEFGTGPRRIRRTCQPGGRRVRQRGRGGTPSRLSEPCRTARGPTQKHTSR